MELTRGFGIPISNNLPVGYEAAFSQEVTWQCLVGVLMRRKEAVRWSTGSPQHALTPHVSLQPDSPGFLQAARRHASQSRTGRHLKSYHDLGIILILSFFFFFSTEIY